MKRMIEKRMTRMRIEIEAVAIQSLLVQVY